MPSPEPAARNANRGGRVLLTTSAAVGALIVLAGLATLVVERVARPVAVNALSDWLRRHGAPSRIELRALDVSGLSARLTLGDPRDPDLTVERLDITYALSGPWNGKPLGLTPRTVRLVRPRLRVGLVDGRLDFRRLDGLVAWGRAQPPSRQPLPDIAIVGGEVRLLTPTGMATMTGSGRLRAGRLDWLQGRLGPISETSIGGVDLATRGGGFRLEGRGRHLLATLDLGPSRLSSDQTADASVSVGNIGLLGETPYPDAPNQIFGPLHLTLSARDVRVETRRGRTAIPTLTADLSGDLDTSATSQKFVGALTGGGAGISAAVAGATLKGGVARLTLTDIALVRDITGFSAEGHGRLSARGGRVKSPRGALTDLAADVVFPASRLTDRDGKFETAFSASGGFRAHAAASPAGARALVRTLPLVAGERPYAVALAGALADFSVAAPDIRLDLRGDGGRFALRAPLNISATSGARLTVVGAVTVGAERIAGAGGLSLAGGGAPSLDLAITDAVASHGGARGHFSGRLAVETAALHDGAVRAAGDLAISGDELRMSLDGCAPIGAARLGPATAPVRDLALRLCPGTGPLFRLANARWRSTGRLEGVGAVLASVNVAAERADLDFDAAGGAAGLSSVRLTLSGMDLSDTAEVQRFRPIALAGRLDLDEGQWRGAFRATLAAGRVSGTLSLVDDVARGEGRLDLAVPNLAFATGGLQPADLSPLAAPIRGVDAHGAVSGWLAWDGHGVSTSGGRLTAEAGRLTGPAGVMRNLSADVRLTSLFPPTSGPGQTLSVGTIEAVIPVTDLQGRFQLEADGVGVERLDAAVAQGRVSFEPFRAPFAPAATVSSALTLRGVDLGQIIAATNVADTVKVEARVNGRIPFTVGLAGLVIQRGTLEADGPGRISISRRAFQSAADAGAPPNYARDFAYQAMEDLAFDSLDATVVSLPKDRLGMIFHVKGRHEPAVRQRAVVRLADLVRGQLFSRPLPLPSGTDIDMTLDTSLNFGELVSAAEGSWRDALAARGVKGAPGDTAGAHPAATTGPETNRR